MDRINDVLWPARCALYVAAAAALLLAGHLGQAQAAPAPWYWWISAHDGQRVCAQFMPRQGWIKGHGPFDNAQCQSARKSLIPAR
jgi:hypothetical protein